MATARHHARLAASADDVWALVRDPASITEWLPGAEKVELDGEDRIVTAMGAEIRERCTVDDPLRRFTYTITDGPMAFDFHRATIDVLEDGDGSIVVYAIELEPSDLVAIMDAITASGVAGLQARFG
jgi:carbon monoxide dehydrogenase subunit G